MAGANIDRELRYIMQWFSEWSELQREDFLPILVECISAAKSDTTTVNGIVSGMASAGFADKPMSLFQCRVKLFREWSIKWPVDIRLSLQEKVKLMDASYGERVAGELERELSGQINGGYINPNPIELIEPVDAHIPSLPIQNEPLLA